MLVSQFVRTDEGVRPALCTCSLTHLSRLWDLSIYPDSLRRLHPSLTTPVSCFINILPSCPALKPIKPSTHSVVPFTGGPRTGWRNQSSGGLPGARGLSESTREPSMMKPVLCVLLWGMLTQM